MILPGSEAPEPICSARACRVPAVWVLAWNNPKLHSPERRKTWLACAEHRTHLAGFLDLRGFLKDVVMLVEWERAAESRSDEDGQGTATEGTTGGASSPPSTDAPE